jgi:hypothetical protein
LREVPILDEKYDDEDEAYNPLLDEGYFGVDDADGNESP